MPATPHDAAQSLLEQSRCWQSIRGLVAIAFCCGLAMEPATGQERTEPASSLTATESPSTPAGSLAQQLVDCDRLLSQIQGWEFGQPDQPLLELEGLVKEFAPGEGQQAVEQKLLSAWPQMKSRAVRQVICELLVYCGSEASLATLTPLLADPELSHSARQVLERLPAPAADEALLQTAQTLAAQPELSPDSSTLLIGLLQALAARRYAPAEPFIEQQIRSTEPAVAHAAIRALGQFGSAAAVQVLRDTRDREAGQPQLVRAIDQSLLVCADRLANAGEIAAAVRLYREMWENPPTPELGWAALRGLAVSGEGEPALLMELIRSDSERRAAAIALVAEWQPRTVNVTQKLAGLLTRLPAADQVLLLDALALRRDPAAVPAVLELLNAEQPAPVRNAAIGALGEMGDGSVVVDLLRLTEGRDATEQRLARRALERLPGTNTNAALYQQVQDRHGVAVVEAIRALAARRATNITPELLTVVRDSRPDVRHAAIRALGGLVDVPQIEPLLRGYLFARPPETRAELLRAVAEAVRRWRREPAVLELVTERISRNDLAQRSTLMPLLAEIGTASAYAELRKWLASSDSSLQAAAQETLVRWPDQQATADLLALLNSAQDPSQRQSVVGALIRIAQADPSAAETIYRDGLAATSITGERKLLLEALGESSLASPSAATLALSYVSTEGIQPAAGLAALRIANRLRTADEKLAREVLTQVLSQVEHADVQQRTREVLNELDKYQDHILSWVGVGPYQLDKVRDGQAIYRATFPPEESATDLAWRPIDRGLNDWNVNLEAFFGELDFAAAYVRTQVWSPSAQAAQLEMGSDDGVRAWLNGQLVHDRFGGGGVNPRQHRAKVELREGWNELLLKVVDHDGAWGFCCRLRRPDGTRLDALKWEAR